LIASASKFHQHLHLITHPSALPNAPCHNLQSLQPTAIYAWKVTIQYRHVNGQSLKSNAGYSSEITMECTSAILPAGSTGRASHQDAQAVHSLLKDTFRDEEAADQWFTRCQSVFCWSQYFAGSKRLQLTSGPESNGVLEDSVAQLSLNGHK